MAGNQAQNDEPQVKLDQTKSNKSKIWTMVILFAVVLLFLIIFLAQNSQTVKISFLWVNGHLSLAVAMLISVLFGAVLVILAGTARILQLRHGAHKQ